MLIFIIFITVMRFHYYNYLWNNPTLSSNNDLFQFKMRYRMFNYLWSNCDLGCKTVWVEVWLCIKEDHCGSLYMEFHESDIIYTCMTLFMTSSMSCNPNDVIFGTKYMEFPTMLGFLRIFVTYSYPNLQQLF